MADYSQVRAGKYTTKHPYRSCSRGTTPGGDYLPLRQCTNIFGMNDMFDSTLKIHLRSGCPRLGIHLTALGCICTPSLVELRGPALRPPCGRCWSMHGLKVVALVQAFRLAIQGCAGIAFCTDRKPLESCHLQDTSLLRWGSIRTLQKHVSTTPSSLCATARPQWWDL